MGYLRKLDVEPGAVVRIFQMAVAVVTLSEIMRQEVRNVIARKRRAGNGVKRRGKQESRIGEQGQ